MMYFQLFVKVPEFLLEVFPTDAHSRVTYAYVIFLELRFSPQFSNLENSHFPITYISSVFHLRKSQTQDWSAAFLMISSGLELFWKFLR